MGTICISLTCGTDAGKGKLDLHPGVAINTADTCRGPSFQLVLLVAKYMSPTADASCIREFQFVPLVATVESPQSLSPVRKVYWGAKAYSLASLTGTKPWKCNLGGAKMDSKKYSGKEGPRKWKVKQSPSMNSIREL